MASAPPLRDRADACPGAVQTHAAADGALARVRIPGGALTPAQLLVLSAAARELGDGALELTSRGNVQLRGVRAGAVGELGDRLADAGLLPSATHETARNVLASVLSGRAGGPNPAETNVRHHMRGSILVSPRRRHPSARAPARGAQGPTR